MSEFDLKQLRTLVAVVDAGSITAGAPRVFLSQSTASEQLLKLEQRAGQVLLHRAKAGVTPTPAGERLIAHARQLLALSERAWRDLHGVPLEGELRLGVTDYFRPAELAVLLARLAQQHPQALLRVTVCKSAEVAAGHAQGLFDLAVCMRVLRRDAPRVPGTLLRQEPLHWMAAAGVRPARNEPLRLLALPETCALHQFTVEILRRRQVRHAVVHVASGVAGLQSALAAGLGVACLNESSLCPGVVPLPKPHGLPALPRVGFDLLARRAGASLFIQRARELLMEQFAD